MTDAVSNVAFAKAIEFLYELRWFGAKLGLDNTFKLAALAGQPQDQLRFVHVAGTNGKGSTCAILESIYREAGLRTGLFTSPHLVSFRERIQVNRELIPEDDVVRLLDGLRPLLAQFPLDHHPTFFEVVTVLALRYFAERKCDVVIWETGLGGRLDATNIVTPLASVITNIQYDHQKWLGDTLECIAREKAGIIKPSVPVITGADEPAAKGVICAAAVAMNAPLTCVDSRLPAKSEVFGELPLRGAHQQRNAAVALAVVAALQDKIPVAQSAIDQGLANVRWPGRFQILTRNDGTRVVLDGAHNLAGAKALAATLLDEFARLPLTLILGILTDKDWRGMLAVLAPLASRIRLVAVPDERTANPEDLAMECRRIHETTSVACHSSLKDALDSAEGEPLVVITGSLYLVGEAMEILAVGPATARERALNEWIPTGTHERAR